MSFQFVKALYSSKSNRFCRSKQLALEISRSRRQRSWWLVKLLSKASTLSPRVLSSELPGAKFLTMGSQTRERQDCSERFEEGLILKSILSIYYVITFQRLHTFDRVSNYRIITHPCYMMKKPQQRTNVELFTKIQEAYPSHLSKLPHKQVGYVVHVDLDKTYKLMNCVESEHHNSELYKRFSKAFLANLSQGQDQMILCCGLEEETRMQTSIGLKKNPGMFMIAGIGVLDEKYQLEYSKYDVEISFLQSREGRLYDLLTGSKQPLKMVRNEAKHSLNFGETYVKINTFTHFLKLFKIALFNNQERDFRPLNNDPRCKQIHSSFIMNIVSKVYDNSSQGNPQKTQKTTLIDLSEYCGVPQQPQSTELDASGQKGIWEYVMIQLNNMTNRKKQHYHLVEENPLLSIIKANLKSSRNYFIAAMSANPSTFEENYKWINQLSELVDSINPIVLEDPKKLALFPKRNSQNPIKLLTGTMTLLSAEQKPKPKNTESKRISGMNSTIMTSSFYKQKRSINYPKQPLSPLQALLQNLEFIKNDILRTKYTSMRDFRDLRERCLGFLEEVNRQVVKFKKIYNKELEVKRKKKLIEHALINDELKLIGSCVKSEHFKDFYSAKSYISLQREVKIKTEANKEALGILLKEREELLKKFIDLKHRGIQNLNRIGQSDKKQGVNSRTLNKAPVTEAAVYTQSVKAMSIKIVEYLIDLYYQVTFEDQRTMADEIIKEGVINEELLSLMKELGNFRAGLEEIGNKTTCNFGSSQPITDAHISMFVREVREMAREGEKKKHSPEIPSLLSNQARSKPQFRSSLKENRPVEDAVKESRNKANSIARQSKDSSKSKFSKLPLLETVCQRIVITGQLSLADILMNPSLAEP